ncbi:hypothetical protein [Paracoccus sp. (in: a-proteobacteria)]|uniref:hypothetical protein n=1 Tax=Paracoccus sp. TaxID=267 RepID=UPI002896A548|nr:hypothetical protein [Paracoccus sp. (in: a-proteobacteria)]
MATIIRLQDLDLSGLGLPTFDWSDYERNLSTLPFLDTWIDPERIGTPAGGGVIDKMRGDTYAQSPVIPARSNNANLGGRMAWNFLGTPASGLIAVRRKPSLSWSAVFAVDLPTDWAGAQRNWLSWQGPALTPARYQAVIQSQSDGRLWVNPAYGASQASRVSAPLVPGPHIIIASWDNDAKRVSLIVDSEVNYTAATFADISSEPADTVGRWKLGGTANSPRFSLGNFMIFDRAIDQDPYTVSRVLAGLKARHGLV